MTTRYVPVTDRGASISDGTAEAIARRVAELVAAAPPVDDQQRSLAVQLLVQPAVARRSSMKPATKQTRAA